MSGLRFAFDGNKAVGERVEKHSVLFVPHGARAPPRPPAAQCRRQRPRPSDARVGWARSEQNSPTAAEPLTMRAGADGRSGEAVPLEVGRK